MNNIELEILNYSYWEHFKLAKDLYLILPITHPKRIELQYAIDKILVKISKLNKEI